MSRFTEPRPQTGPSNGVMSDELTRTAVSATVGALTGVGLGACMTLAPRTTLWPSLCFCGFAALSRGEKLCDWSKTKFGPTEKG